MATPYLQIRLREVASTQDFARAELGDLPVVVIAEGQSAGRGRSGTEWRTAPRALAVSAAVHLDQGDSRPLSLMAGVAAGRALGMVRLKWPNDLIVDARKAGGILVERSGRVVTIGLGVNLWWPAAPTGIGAVLADDPGADAHREIAGVWAAELMGMIEDRGWPLDEYKALCSTLGRRISWEPAGSGIAIDVGQDGSLLVEEGGVVRALVSGAVTHIRG